MNMMGYKNKTGFMAGLTVAQVSEFSLILMALAFSFGHIDQQTVSFVTLVAIITIVGSTYLFNYSDKLFALSKGMLQALQIRKKLKKEPKLHLDGPEMIIFGYDRVGFDFARVAQSLGFRYVVVDFNPDSIRKMQDAQIPFRFGDAEDVEFLQEIGIAEAKIIVSTIPEFKTNKMLVSYYRRSNTEGIAMVISHDIKQARDLYLEGASYVVMPHYLGAHHASSMLAEFGLDISLFEKERNRHLVHLAHREQILK
jgi:voltage-gated potassium channel Kch